MKANVSASMLINDFWQSLQPQVQAALIGAGATAFSACIATVVVFIQIGRQSRNAMRQKRHDEALKLKLEVYQQILKIYNSAIRAQLDLIGYVRGFQMALTIARSQRTMRNPNPLIPKERYPEVHRLYFEALMKSVDVILVVEEWQAMDLRMVVFKDAINAANYDVQQVMTRYGDLALKMMPTPRVDKLDEVYPWQPPDDEGSRIMALCSDMLLSALDDLGCYLSDFRTEMQNLLVAELFGNKAPVRKPLDPSKIVVELAQHRQLSHYFNNDTNWGQNAKQVLQSVSDELKRKAG